MYNCITYTWRYEERLVSNRIWSSTPTGGDALQLWSDLGFAKITSVPIITAIVSLNKALASLLLSKLHSCSLHVLSSDLKFCMCIFLLLYTTTVISFAFPLLSSSIRTNCLVRGINRLGCRCSWFSSKYKYGQWLLNCTVHIIIRTQK